MAHSFTRIRAAAAMGFCRSGDAPVAGADALVGSPLLIGTVMHLEGQPMSTATKPSNDRLVRDLQPMPDFVRDAFKKRRLADTYAERPAYQRNDYLMWINDAPSARKPRRAAAPDAGRTGGRRHLHGDEVERLTGRLHRVAAAPI
jgi:hypothetical protein